MNPSLRSSPAALTAFGNLGGKDRFKIFVGGLLFPRQTRQWLQFAAGNPFLRERMPQMPLALTKIYCPYSSTQLDRGRRAEILSRHYAYLCQPQLGELLAAAALAPVTLSEWACISGEPAALELTAIHDGHREGDLCLRLVCKSQTIYSASFTLLEAGAARLADGDIQVSPLAAPEFDIESAPSKKRSVLRKKLALTEAVFSDLRRHFVALASHRPAQRLAERQHIDPALQFQADAVLLGREARIAGLQPVEAA